MQHNVCTQSLLLSEIALFVFFLAFFMFFLCNFFMLALLLGALKEKEDELEEELVN